MSCHCVQGSKRNSPKLTLRWRRAEQDGAVRKDPRGEGKIVLLLRNQNRAVRPSKKEAFEFKHQSTSVSEKGPMPVLGKRLFGERRELLRLPALSPGSCCRGFQRGGGGGWGFSPLKWEFPTPLVPPRPAPPSRSTPLQGGPKHPMC